MNKTRTITMSELIFKKINKNGKIESNNETTSWKGKVLSVKFIDENEETFASISIDDSFPEESKNSSHDLENADLSFLEENYKERYISEILFPVSILILINISIWFIKKKIDKNQ